jgi:hypothetical protein
MSLFTFSIIESVVLLIAVNCVAARRRYALITTVVLGIGFLVVPFLMCLSFPAVMYQTLFLFLLLPVLLIPRRGRKLYFPLSCVATLVAYGIVMMSAYEKREETYRLREEYAFESIESRLPIREPKVRLGVYNLDGLNQLEKSIEEVSQERFFDSRTAKLRRLHEKSVNEFTESVGFGVGRMSRLEPNAENLKRDLHPRMTEPQPDYFHPFVDEPGELKREPNWNAQKMFGMHLKGVIDFVNPKGFGYVKSRKEIAGFQDHGMSKVPESEKPWRIARLDLIGLQVHDDPVVYDSANLPKMDELRGAKTRPLDAFESESLAALKKGEDFFVRGTNEKARMVGAIRATKQCLECHGGSRGDLLGAFSYGFRREEN